MGSTRLHRPPGFVAIADDGSYVLRSADLCVADGVGLLRRATGPACGRVTGSDGTPLIARRAAARGLVAVPAGRGARRGRTRRQSLIQQNPGLRVAGTWAGSPAPEEEDDIVARVNASGADILLVAYGAPRQDLWIARNRDRLKVNVAMGVGGSLDFVAGVVPRAPRWMRRLALEWLYRLYKQPWRWRRMLRLPRFVWAVVRHRERPFAREGETS